MRIFLTLLPVALLLLTGCQKEDPAPVLSIVPEIVNAAAAAGSYTVNVTSNVAWTASANAEWLTLAPAANEGGLSIPDLG
jgi:hypothetical protein